MVTDSIGTALGAAPSPPRAPRTSPVTPKLASEKGNCFFSRYYYYTTRSPVISRNAFTLRNCSTSPQSGLFALNRSTVLS